MGLADLPDHDSRPLAEQLAKPRRGTALLDREATKQARKNREDEVIADAKRLDGYRCRWPEAHKCRGGLEGAHVFQHRGMGGNPAGDRTTVDKILTVCAWIHRRGPETIDGGDLEVEAETPQGTRGPCSFWRRSVGGRHLIAREVLPGVTERD